MAVANKKTDNSTNSIDNSVKFDDDGPQWRVGPIMRNNLRKLSFDAFTKSAHDDAILHDSKVPSCSYMKEYFNHDCLSPSIDNQTIRQSIDLHPKTGNDLVDYLAGLHIGDYFSDSKTTADDDDIQKQVQDLYSKCAELPSEWTVVQLSQLFDNHNAYATIEDTYTSDSPIKITLYRYHEQSKSDPLNVIFNLNEFGANSITSTAHEVYQVLYKEYVASASQYTKHGEFIKNLTELQTKLLNDMKLWLGPWITLLSGKIKGEDGAKFEKIIFNEVEQFVREIKTFTDNQAALLNLVARRIDLLTSDKIKQAAQEICNTKTECTRTVQFLASLKTNTKFQHFDYYPCILVIDELLDLMPWEMMLPSQEYSRIHSIYLLLDLYDKYKDQIVDGYLKVCVKSGFAVINPDNDIKLKNMNERMGTFYDDCLPKWERIESVIPSLSQISESLAKNDLFVYSGHGSSLQYFTNDDFANINYNCLMFLFGCDSIAMKAQGSICEAACSSYTFFKSGCPGMLGSISIVTDIWIDLITMLVLTQWVVSDTELHPVVNVCTDGHSKERVHKILAKIKGKRNGNLLALLCDIRKEVDISIRMRSSIVYRGLPTYNDCV